MILLPSFPAEAALTSFPTEHRVPSQGYCFTLSRPGKFLPERAREYGHMIFSQAAQIAAEAGVRELWLAHYSQMAKDPQAALPNARAHFENTVCGADGMAAMLRFS